MDGALGDLVFQWLCMHEMHYACFYVVDMPFRSDLRLPR